MKFHRLANNAKIAGLVASGVSRYAAKSGQPLEPTREPWESPALPFQSLDASIVRNVVSDIIANLAHYATIHGVAASEVITDAIRSFAEEISGDESHESCGKLDANLGRLRSLLEEIVFVATIGTVSDKPTDEAENDAKEQT